MTGNCRKAATFFLLLLLGTCAARAANKFADSAETTSTEGFNLSEWLRAGAFAELDKKLPKLAACQSRDFWGKRLVYQVYEWRDDSDDLDASTQAWVKAAPQSYWAHLIRGIYLNRYGWKARGTNFSYAVKQSDIPVFKERLARAREELEIAGKLNPKDVGAPEKMISVALGLGLSKAKTRQYFDAAVANDASYYKTYEAMQEFLMPKWYGSREEEVSFSREQAKKAPFNSYVHWILFDAHNDLASPYSEGEQHWSEPGVWEDLQLVFNTEIKWRNLSDAHSRYAFYARKCGHPETMKTELQLAGLWWSVDTWKNFDDVIKARAEVFPEYAGIKGTAGQARWELEQADKSIQANSQDSFAYFVKALASMRLEKPDVEAAKSALNTAIHIHPYAAEYYLELMNIAEKNEGNHRLAAQIGREALTKFSGRYEFYEPVLKYYLDQQRSIEGAAIEKPFYENVGHYYKNKYYKALADAISGRTADALALTGHEIFIEPEALGNLDLGLLNELNRYQAVQQANFHQARGYAQWLAGNNAEALRNCQAALRLADEPGLSLYVLTRVRLNDKDQYHYDARKGLEFAQQLLARKYDHPAEDYFWFGKALAANGKTQDAAAAYENGLKADAGYTSASLALAGLKKH